MTSTPYRLCAIIPTYNNPKTLATVVDAAARHVENVLVIDDGSGPPGRAAAAQVAQRKGVLCQHRAQNGGKGAAVKDGLRLAHDLGFTHALQIDADAQHDLADIETFISASRRQPDALILGAPIFDASAPKGRLYGRRITIFWTQLETFGRAITDPMCGFRIYPVASALRAGARGNRMDFDIEIAVRLRWMGLSVVNIPTRVRYLSPQQGGTSSFRMFSDNLAISWLHTRLVTAKLVSLMLSPFSPRRRLLPRKKP